MEKSSLRENDSFSEDFRKGVYKAIYSRRDVRSQFKSDPIPNDTLCRILMAAHHAPSVGFMQPWNFIIIKSESTKKKIHKSFKKENAKALGMFKNEKKEIYKSLKLEGILEAPINICITCDRSRSGPVVIGRTTTKANDLYSSVCAVQNLWLAARAEGVGVGWVSILDNRDIRKILNIPSAVIPIAYLCMGYVTHFCEKPELESVGWRNRIPLADVVFTEAWDKQDKDNNWGSLFESINKEMHRVNSQS